MRSLSIFLLGSLLSTASAAPRAPAFPGAEGAAAWVTGGRGGKILKVTNLNDDGPGSLRAALAEKTPRLILFTVSGNIVLKSRLQAKSGNFTIAGQSAPGGGICIQQYGMDLSDLENVIIRYLRFRPGDGAGIQLDALGGRNCRKIMIDHCSASWSVDETVSFYDAEDLTVQWCLIAESLYRSVHHKGEHGYGGIWGGNRSSWHHNLLASHTSRNPRIEREEDPVDVRNNVLFNWGYNSIYGGERSRVNIVNNYYIPGPATQEKCRTRFAEIEGKGGRWFIEGNVIEGAPQLDADNWQGGVHNPWATESEVRSLQSFPAAYVTPQTASDAMQQVLQNVGAVLPKRDAVDQRILDSVKSRTATVGKSFEGGGNGIIDSPADVGGWPKLESVAAPADSDGDGMPDDWEKLHQLNVSDATDGNQDADNDGYPNVEEYLNQTLPRKPEPAVELAPLAVVTVKPAQPALFHPDGLTVSPDGTEDARTITEAIQMAPAKRTKPYVIKIKPGIYKERIIVPKEKSYLKFRGSDEATTILTNNFTQETDNGRGGKMSGRECATLLVEGSDFFAEKLTIENSHGPGVQALAAFVSGDRAHFKDCRLLGWQDTLRVDDGRSYFKECVIHGSVDFIYGSGTAWFEKCIVHCVADGYITAPSTAASQAYGFVFMKCQITNAPAASKIFLGRPWQPHGSTHFIKCELPAAILPTGWNNWGNSANELTARFVEFDNKGPGANLDGRVKWSKTLAKETAKALTVEHVLNGNDGWNPSLKTPTENTPNVSK
jgi:pectinesterase